jgi:hypothetical protein
MADKKSGKSNPRMFALVYILPALVFVYFALPFITPAPQGLGVVELITEILSQRYNVEEVHKYFIDANDNSGQKQKDVRTEVLEIVLPKVLDSKLDLTAFDLSGERKFVPISAKEQHVVPPSDEEIRNKLGGNEAIGELPQGTDITVSEININNSTPLVKISLVFQKTGYYQIPFKFTSSRIQITDKDVKIPLDKAPVSIPKSSLKPGQLAELSKKVDQSKIISGTLYFCVFDATMTQIGQPPSQEKGKIRTNKPY